MTAFAVLEMAQTQFEFGQGTQKVTMHIKATVYDNVTENITPLDQMTLEANFYSGDWRYKIKKAVVEQAKAQLDLDVDVLFMPDYQKI